MGVSDGGAFGVFETYSGTGIAAIGQSRQRSRANVFPSALGISPEELIGFRRVVVQPAVTLIDSVSVRWAKF